MFGLRGMPPVVKNLLVINVLVYFFELYIINANPRIFELMVMHFVKSPDFRPHQLVTHIFMHSPISFSHILFNMIGVWVFGSMLEEVWGSKRFLIFYMVVGIGAAFCDQIYLLVRHFMLQNTLDSSTDILSLMSAADKISDINGYSCLGASGALYGLIMGAAMLFPNRELYIYFAIPIKLKFLAIFYGVGEVFSAIQNNPGDNIAHVVHLGGMIFGFIMIKIWNRDRTQFY